MKRIEVLEAILAGVEPHDRIVSALGYISRDWHVTSSKIRKQCFYCQGSMGSVIPFSLGVALARSDIRVLALEGDGSLLMNLGALATVKNCAQRLRIIIFDNGCYESTGGQPSQPAGFDLTRVLDAFHLKTYVASEVAAVKTFLEDSRAAECPVVLVAKVAPSPSAPRIKEPLELIKGRFQASVNGACA